jgi:hypothetical protein
MIEDHLEYLKNLAPLPQGNVGRNAMAFGNKIQTIEGLPSSLNKVFNRNDLFNISKDENYSNLAVAVAILAWGGMRYDHARKLFSNWGNLDPIIKKLRKREISNREEAFKILQQERGNNKLPGLGIGYYTKLICFLNENIKGYIMDQWTAKSINLIWGDNLINVASSGWVTDRNDAGVYECFCGRIEELANYLSCTPLEAEERIFSVGGKNVGEWRKYLKIKY